MGLNQGGGNRTYLKISSGKIAKRVDEGAPEAVKCSNKENTKTWYEQRFASVSGTITDVKKRKHDYGEDLCITIEDGGETFELQMPWSSKYSAGFFMCMPNIDVRKPVTFSPWAKEVVEDGKPVKKTALYLKQDGQDNIKWYWTKENPMDLPPMVKIKVKGHEVWDDTDRQEYFERHLNDVFIPALKLACEGKYTGAVSANKHDYHAKPSPAAQYIDEPEDDGLDLPF